MISLSIRGLAFCDPLDVKLPNHAALLGKNGSGKTTILNAIRLMATGECAIEGVGNVPGAFLALARAGQPVEIAIEVDGVGATATIAKRGQRDLKARVLGFDCRLANVAMRGSAEEVRKFLAANVRPSPEWTRERAREEIAKRNRGVCPPLNPAPSIIDSLNLALSAQKEESRRRRDAVRTATAASVGAAEAAAKADAEQVARSYDEAKAEADALRADRAAIAKERAQLTDTNIRFAAAKRAVDRARDEWVAATKRAETIGVDEREINDAITEKRRAIAEITRIEAELETLDGTEAMEREGAEATQSEAARLAGEAKSLGDRIGTLGDSCPTCERPVAPELFEGFRASLARAKADAEAARLAMDAQHRRYALARAKTDELRVRLAAEERALDTAEKTLDAFRRSEQEREHAARVAKDLEGVLATARQSLDAIPTPPSPEALDQRDVAISDRLAAVTSELRVHDQRRHARAMAAKCEADAAVAHDALSASLTTEDAIRMVRDEITKDAIRPLATALESVARVLGDAAVVDLGDEEREPTIGIRRGDDVIGFQTLSGGERAMFLACLSAALMDLSPAPPERRILLLEAAELDKQHLRSMLNLLKETNIGHTVVAHPTDEAGDLAVLLARGFKTIDATPKQQLEEVVS